MKPDTLFAQALDYMFDPYGTGHVTLEDTKSLQLYWFDSTACSHANCLQFGAQRSVQGSR